MRFDEEDWVRHALVGLWNHNLTVTFANHGGAARAKEITYVKNVRCVRLGPRFR